ncbi:MAG: ABC transporter ATP-binding protein [Gammaproteobacteria bacterium]|nr:ABC transporter ATP-binding protein [Gammaproteobacteria bacterium]
MENIIQLNNVRKEFKKGENVVEVLNGVNLTLNQGELIAIIGPSGSGKTTLLQIIGLLDKPTKGDLFVKGENQIDLTDKSRSRLRNQFFGFVYQFHHLINEFSALENTMMPLLVRNEKIKDAKSIARELLSSVGLQGREDHKPHELSGGECQRVAVARALVTSPNIILADEPTGNLDPDTAETVFEKFINLNRSLNSSLIMVTHNHQLAETMDRLIELKHGKLIEIR